MDATRVDMFLTANATKFAQSDIPYVRDRLLSMDESAYSRLVTLPLKSPMTMLIISFLGGPLGIDRFLLGETGLGVAKLLTCGGLGIWAIVDLFLIGDATRRKNIELFNMVA